MTIAIESVGKLGGGGGALVWNVEELPQRTVSWDGSSVTEYFTPPTDKAFIAYAEVEVFQGENLSNTVGFASEISAGYEIGLVTNALLSERGSNKTHLIGLEEEASNKGLKVYIAMGYQAPKMTYKIYIHWAEVPS